MDILLHPNVRWWISPGQKQLLVYNPLSGAVIEMDKKMLPVLNLIIGIKDNNKKIAKNANLYRSCVKQLLKLGIARKKDG
ncbi:MAG: hypothetical protein ABIH18_08080 [Candidatus Omnitrophota bacterium]